MRRGVQQLRNKQNMPSLRWSECVLSSWQRHDHAYLVCSVCLAVQPDNLNDTHLQQLIHAWYLIKHLHDVLHRPRHGTVGEEDESVPFTCRVRFSSKESLNEFRSVGNEMFKLAVDGVYSENGVLADI